MVGLALLCFRHNHEKNMPQLLVPRRRRDTLGTPLSQLDLQLEVELSSSVEWHPNRGVEKRGRVRHVHLLNIHPT